MVIDHKPVLFFAIARLFAGDDSLAGANLCAAAALDASIGIDVIDVAFRDSLYGTYGETSAASNALISDYVSHDSLSFN